MRTQTVIILLSLLTYAFSGHSKEEWKSRTVYQLLTDRFATADGSQPGCDLAANDYCGGKYQGIINQLDYIKGMGFDAIWISPHVDNWPHSFHGYHFRHWYEINENFGSADDLKALIQACHAKDIWVMADVIANHVAPVDQDYSQIDPFNSAEHYHDFCVIHDYNNQQEVENCRFVDNIPDLKQENDWVAEELVKWIKWTVDEYDFDGIRIDTVKHVPQWFWDKFTPAAGVFQVGEVFDGRNDYTASYQQHMDSIFNYPFYFHLKNAFCNRNMFEVKDWFYVDRPYFPDPSVLGTIVENHDNPRMLSSDYCGNKLQFNNLLSGLVVNLLFEGIPFFYYGGEQGFSGGNDPYDREPMWGHYDTSSEGYFYVQKSIEARKQYQLWNDDCTERYIDNDFFAFTRGTHILVCISHDPTSKTVMPKIWPSGTTVCNIFNPNDCLTQDGDNLYVNMEDGHPKAYVAK